MAQQILNGPPQRTMALNTGDSAERGDTPLDLVTKMNAMLNDLYGMTAAGSKYSTGSGTI